MITPTQRQNIGHIAEHRVIVFYSSIGLGHFMAAKCIQEEILRQEPSATVMLKDIRGFMSSWHRRADERLYWFVVNEMPELFEHLFWARQEQGNLEISLSSLPNDYPPNKILDFIHRERPTCILATHYGSAQVLGVLREQGQLTDIKLGWLHTDFFEGYFPRISKRIDHTFLAHPELESRWISAGVPYDMITTCGMPVSIHTVPRETIREFLKTHNLDPSIPLILVSGGKEGIGDFAGIVRSIDARATSSIQVVLLCGASNRNLGELQNLPLRLSPQVKVKAFGLIPHHEVVKWMQSATVLITKAGGVTPVEAFSIGVPTILIDAVWGHERENANLFCRHGLAKFAADSTLAGTLAVELIFEDDRRRSMIEAQKELLRYSDTGLIARFALHGSPCGQHSVPDPVIAQQPEEARKAMAQLDALNPASVEILLSYSVTKAPEQIAFENPFGHIAIRVLRTVYSTNHLSEPSEYSNLLQHMALGDYLYSAVPPAGVQELTSTFGMAYGRDTIGLRISGIKPEDIENMAMEAQLIEKEFRSGAIRWDRSEFNCADAVARILAAAGFDLLTWDGARGLNTMPLDVFERALLLFHQNPSYTIELVAYRRLPVVWDKHSQFPLSITNPLRSATRIICNASPETLRLPITKQMIGFGSGRLFVEDLSCRPHTSVRKIQGSSTSSKRFFWCAVFASINRILKKQIGSPLQRIGNRWGSNGEAVVQRVSEITWTGVPAHTVMKMRQVFKFGGRCAKSESASQKGTRQ